MVTLQRLSRMSQGNASNARGALSSVKVEHKDTSGAISREEKKKERKGKKKLSKLPFVAKK